jgi:hypothetical protein
MDMGRVVPVAREGRGWAVEHDASAHKHQPLHEPLDGAELVGHVENCGSELDVELFEQPGEGLLSLDVDAGGGLVQDEEVRLTGERLRDVGALALAARETVNRGLGPLEQANALDRSPNGRSVPRPERAKHPSPRYASGRHELADRHGRLDPEESSLRQVAKSNTVLEALRRLVEEERLTRCRAFEAEGEADQGGLATTVRAGDADELTQGDVEIDVPEDRRAARVRERQVSQRDR